VRSLRIVLVSFVSFPFSFLSGVTRLFFGPNDPEASLDASTFPPASGYPERSAELAERYEFEDSGRSNDGLLLIGAFASLTDESFVFFRPNKSFIGSLPDNE